MYAQRFYVLIETSRHGDPLQLFTTFPFGPGPHVAWRIFAGLRSKSPWKPPGPLTLEEDTSRGNNQEIVYLIDAAYFVATKNRYSATYSTVRPNSNMS